MAERKARADALRNRETVLAAADELFARSESPRSVSMDEIAAAAGVGKGTLFRRFGDRTGLIRAVYEARIEPLRHAVEAGPAPLGPSAPPRERVPALLDAVLCFKLDNRHLSLALEEAGSGSPYQAAHYAWWHGILRDMLERMRDAADGTGNGPAGGTADRTAAGPAPESDFTAHALLAATRADLVEHLVGQEGMDRERIRAQLAAFVGTVLGQG
ncbi:TetR/AcrR family transcriptional regulator [Streptomyces inhibens]|uniref:TetR/AcrR family transcriptional regulator n=1 Tax=Streptomyces inhibens TaxID=2293571 RepID=UPI00402AE273